VSAVEAPAGRILLDADALRRTLSWIADEIIEANPDLSRVALVGIQTRGVPIAQRVRRLVEERSGSAPDIGAVDITFYRDDVHVEGGGAPLDPQPVGGENLPTYGNGRIQVRLVEVDELVKPHQERGERWQSN
jgi:pyrimidine operon attenuation protein/uracil phosphoribosyltransferase